MPQSPDLLIALGRQWHDTRGEIAREDSDGVCDSLSDRLEALEKQMIPLVATTPQGLAAQVRILRDLVPHDYAPLVDNVLAGLQRLLS